MDLLWVSKDKLSHFSWWLSKYIVVGLLQDASASATRCLGNMYLQHGISVDFLVTMDHYFALQKIQSLWSKGFLVRKYQVCYSHNQVKWLREWFKLLKEFFKKLAWIAKVLILVCWIIETHLWEREDYLLKSSWEDILRIRSLTASQFYCNLYWYKETYQTVWN